MLEVVDDSLAVEEVHSSRKPVPVKALGGSQGTGAARDVGDSDNLLKGDDLDGRDDRDDVDVAHKERGEKEAKHDKAPEGASDKVGLLLLVIGLFISCSGGLLCDGNGAHGQLGSSRVAVVVGGHIGVWCFGRRPVIGLGVTRTSLTVASWAWALTLEGD